MTVSRIMDQLAVLLSAVLKIKGSGVKMMVI